MTKPMTDAQKKAAADKRKAKKAKADPVKADKAAADQAKADAQNDAGDPAGAGADAGSGDLTAGSTKPAPPPNDQPNAAGATGAGAGKDSDEGKTSPAKSDPAPPKQPVQTAARRKAWEDGPRISVKTARGVKSRWRAGYKFGPEAVEILIDDLSEDQAEAIRDDPALVLELLGGS